MSGTEYRHPSDNNNKPLSFKAVLFLTLVKGGAGVGRADEQPPKGRADHARAAFVAVVRVVDGGRVGGPHIVEQGKEVFLKVRRDLVLCREIRALNFVSQRATTGDTTAKDKGKRGGGG